MSLNGPNRRRDAGARRFGARSLPVPVLLAMVAVACGATSTAPTPTPSSSADGAAPTLDGGPGEDARMVPSDAPPPPPEDTAGGTELLLASELLGRPTAQSVTVNAAAAQAIEAYVERGVTPGAYDAKTPIAAHAAGEAFSVLVDGLTADTAYVYRLRWRRPGDATFRAGPERRFRTQRRPGATFRFTMQADSHNDENSVYDQYLRTLANVESDAPDFHIDLGDTFMCDKHSVTFVPSPPDVPARDKATVDARYLYERGNFARIAHSTPLFLVNGNHDAEAGFLSKGAGDDLATWATLARHRLFPNPVPNGFYGGDSLVEPFVGERAAWYAWQWGDALFVALDPYWNTKTKSNSDAWVWTLGQRQYQWLAQTLGSSSAKYKFVFLHNLVGGLDGQMRGGAEAAPYFEWGGLNADGTPGFEQHRPGWGGKPIHQLLVESRVTAVFHGHDHLYAKQELEGIVYQEVPQPSAKNTNNAATLARDYHYDSGTILPSAGHVRVTVAPDRVTAEYVRSWLPASETPTRKNGEIADTYTMGGP